MAVDISALTSTTDFLTPYQVKKIIYDYKTNVRPPVYPQGVSVSLSKYTAIEGETVTATATITPPNHDAKRVKSVTWSASGSVNINLQNGIITARSAGTATITATVTYKPVSMDDSEVRTITGTAQLSVQPATVYADYIVVSLDSSSITEGDTTYARATVYPANASNRSVTWRSSSPSIASIDSTSGKITARAPGSVYFTATAADGSGRTASTSNLQIAAKEVKVSSIYVTVDPSTVTAGGTSQATATVYPTNATNNAVTWSISPTTGASIKQSGAITTTAQGNYTVIATAKDGSNIYGIGSLIVNAKMIPVTSIVVSLDKTSIKVNESTKATANITPSNATNQTVTWSISPTDGAVIDQSGNITATKANTYTVTASATDGSQKTETATLTVTEAIQYDLLEKRPSSLQFSLLSDGYYSHYAPINLYFDPIKNRFNLSPGSSYTYDEYENFNENSCIATAYNTSAQRAFIGINVGSFLHAAYYLNNQVYFGEYGVAGTYNGVIKIDSKSYTSYEKFFNDITFGAGKFVAVGNSGAIVYFTNLTDGRFATSVTPNNLNKVLFANSRFVAIGNSGVILTSTNGQSWSAVNSDAAYGNNLNDITYGNGKWVVVGNNGTVLVSANGTTFTRVEDQIYKNRNIRSVAYGAGYFVMCMDGVDPFGQPVSSKDMKTFKYVGVQSQGNISIARGSMVEYGNGIFKLIGFTGSSIAEYDIVP